MIEMLMALLKTEILGESLEEKTIQQITPEVIKKLYAIAIRHDLAHLVGAALKKQNFLGDDEVSKKFFYDLCYAVARTEMIQSEQSKIYELFEEEQIAFVPLKGAVIREYYPESWQRTSCDIDILVRQDEVERAKELLVSHIGYCVRLYNYHDISLYSSSGVHLELHFSILEHKDNIDLLLGDVWDYVSPIEKDSYQYIMSPEYFMFHILAHMLHHFLHGGCGIRAFIDMWLLRTQVGYDKKVLDDLCQMCGIQTFAKYVWKLTDIWFSDGKHDDVSLAMESYIVNGGTFGNKKNMMTITKTGTEGKMRYVLKRFFPSKKVLSIPFPQLNEMPFLYPYYAIKRWGKLLTPEKIHSTVKEMKLYNEIPQDCVEGVKELFRKLEVSEN